MKFVKSNIFNLIGLFCSRLGREVDKPRGLAKCSTIDNAFNVFDF